MSKLIEYELTFERSDSSVSTSPAQFRERVASCSDVMQRALAQVQTGAIFLGVTRVMQVIEPLTFSECVQIERELSNCRAGLAAVVL